VIDFRNWHLSLGKRFRTLKLWFMLRGFGVEEFQRNVRKVRRHPTVEFHALNPLYAVRFSQ
jgi:hypothetical protein